MAIIGRETLCQGIEFECLWGWGNLQPKHVKHWLFILGEYARDLQEIADCPIIIPNLEWITY